MVVASICRGWTGRAQRNFRALKILCMMPQWRKDINIIMLLSLSHQVVSDSATHGLQCTNFPFPSPSLESFTIFRILHHLPESYSDSHPLSWWCYLTILIVQNHRMYNPLNEPYVTMDSGWWRCVSASSVVVTNVPSGGGSENKDHGI